MAWDNINLDEIKALTAELEAQLGNTAHTVAILGATSNTPWIKWSFKFKKMYRDARRKGYTLNIYRTGYGWLWDIEEFEHRFYTGGIANKKETVVPNFKERRPQFERELIQKRRAGKI